MRVIKALAIAGSFTLLSFSVKAEESLPTQTHADKPVSYHADIKPIFVQHCYGCHQGAKQLGDYVMTNFAALVAGGESDRAAIVAGKPDECFLVEQITPVDGHAEMPDEPFPALSDVEIETIRRWIKDGAVDDSPSDSSRRYDAKHPPVYAAPPTFPSIDVSPDGSLVAVAGYHEVILVGSELGEVKDRWVGISPRINTVRFSPDGKLVAAVGGIPGELGELQVWKVDSGELRLSVPITYDTLCGASWSPDGSRIAFGASDHTVRAVDATTGQEVLFQGAHDDWVRDTAFTSDGKHLISVARDMSCKLTEVETQRFVDNITSITPGALSGGLGSVVAHPERDEIVVGGADGAPKVYRVFRQTARKIGDDANLVRALPKLDGRIVSVAISPDGSCIAALATLDGKSEARVWKYDFNGTISPELKKILAKRITERSAEENKLVDEQRVQKTAELARYEFEDTAAYALAIAKDNSLWVAAADGTIRHLGRTGKTLGEFHIVNIAPAKMQAGSRFDARAWNEFELKTVESRTAKPTAITGLSGLSVEPAEITLDTPYDYSQLIVTANRNDGASLDITRDCRIKVPKWLTLTPSGLVRAAGNGTGEIVLRYGEHRRAIKVTAKNIVGDQPNHGSVDYLRDVSPVLSRLGCNQGTCHGAQKGKNGFRLSLRGYDPIFDLRALTDDLSARRINPAAPEESLMLRKPLGITPHQGGVLMRPGDPNHSILRRWIADGSLVDMNSPRVNRIDIMPHNPIAESVDAKQQVRVVAHYSDGSSRDVTREAFIESGNTEVAKADSVGLLSAVRRGEAPILARYEGAYAATTLTVMGDRSGYESVEPETWTLLDQLVAEKWSRVKVTPSELCDDATFLRRVYLDLTGLPPTSDQVREFLADKTPTRVKRARVTDTLIGSGPFVEYWTNKWADLLQVNRKFLDVEGSKLFRQWIRSSVADNRPYDKFVHQILTASGSNKENPPASYFKVLRNPEDTMENTTHLFLGIRFNCNKCHDHPFERWTQDQYFELASYFSQVALQRDPASGNRTIAGTAVEGAKPLFEKVVDKSEGDIDHPRTGKSVTPGFPFPLPHQTDEGKTRREKLANWITDKENPYFARSYVNRLWGYLLGVGLIEPIDDIRAGNPATNPELLDHLTAAFVESGFDTRQMFRMICNSRTYQLSVATNQLNQDDQLNYSHALPRRLPAEVIYDVVHAVTGSISHIPGVPAGTRAAALSDSGVRLADGFLQNLGRPARESACECERSSDLQLGSVMALISGPTIGAAISDSENELERLVEHQSEDRAVAEEIFLRAIGRMPTEAELDAYAEMTTHIRDDHRSLSELLVQAEKGWQLRRVELESQRQKKLAETIEAIEARKTSIKPERDRLEQERTKLISDAQKDLDAETAKLAGKVTAWEKTSAASVEWFPLAATNLSATNKAELTALADRSIIVSGNSNQGVYSVSANTSLSKITGFRIETLADPDLPSRGPGLAGNFVLTEFEVTAAPVSDRKRVSKLEIKDAKADFLQNGFDIKQTFDGASRGQKGWAVSGAVGVDHWAVFKLAKPIEIAEDVSLTFRLHQFHSAPKHRLGRFRISATTAEGDLPLGRPETLAAVLSTPPANRDESATKILDDYVSAVDPDIRKYREALAVARRPVPPDERLVALEQRKEALSKPTAVDPNLVQLREDVKQSEMQVKNLRLTAAEDLTWALVNSPAFLFNH